MKKIIIVNANINKYTKNTEYDDSDNKNDFTNDEIVDLLVKAQKMRYKYPTSKVFCCLDSDMNISTKYPDIHRVISNVYDNVLETNSKDLSDISKRYNTIKIYNSDEIGTNDNIFDDDYEYYQIKQQLGPILTDHFMFKERDLQ